MKTASRILGTALFLEGFEIQDAPRYGAERRGAPIFAYVRAARGPINERGMIQQPDLVVVADDTLVGVPAAGVLQGVDEHTVMLIYSTVDAAEWGDRLHSPARLIVLPAEQVEDRLEQRYVGAICAGAAARLVGEVRRESLEQAIRDELGPLGEAVVSINIDKATEAFDQMAAHEGVVEPSLRAGGDQWGDPGWVTLPFEAAESSSPSIYGGITSVEVHTGLWRTMRPVVDRDSCNGCWWVCGSYCPDGVISVDREGMPVIDYDHCKGCMVCVAQCPADAIEAIPETVAREQEEQMEVEP